MGQKRQEGHMTYMRGFTIVELLIVIVVLAILTTIVTVAYNGVTSNARRSSLLSDLSNAATIMATDRSINGNYAEEIGDVHNGAGLPATSGTTYSFHSSGAAYCITGYSADGSVGSYYISNIQLTPTSGECAQDAGVATTTGAGNGTVGAAIGAGTVATLAGPAGLVADTSGNLYFTDQQSSRIRKITTDLVVSNLAGNGPTGSTEGIGSAALFNWPQALTVGPGNVLYIADTNNSRIRVLPLNGTTATSTLAGGTQGNVGTIGASGSTLRFNTPRGIAYDTSSNAIYLADSQNHTIRKLSTAGVLLANIGQSTGGYINSTGTAARFNYPQGLAVDTSGNLFVADTLNHTIRKVTPAGVVTTVAGNGTQGNTDGIGTDARFRSPMALAVATDGTVYVADTGNNLIRKISPTGAVTTIAGNGTAGFQDGTATDTSFNEPKGIAIGSDGKLYVTDRANNRIRVLNI